MVQDTTVKNTKSNKKYILSIDGGGVRTIASIIFLTKLEAKLKFHWQKNLISLLVLRQELSHVLDWQ